VVPFGTNGHQFPIVVVDEGVDPEVFGMMAAENAVKS